MKRSIWILYSCILLFSAVVPVHAQTQLVPVLVSSVETTGTITSIDKDNRLLQIKSYLKNNLASYQLLEIYVRDKAHITKGEESLSFSDLKVNDKVSVQYFTDIEGRSNATSIALNK